MFRRRRTDADLVVFDVGEDGVLSEPVVRGEAEPGDEADGEPAEPARTGRSPAHARRQLVAAGSVLVVGLTAWGVASAVDERQRVEHLSDAPGGVLSLAEPPGTLWEADTESADEPVFLPGLVVVRRGTALHALDARTGDERWQAEVGGDAHCSSPGLTPGATVTNPVVCWSGDLADGPTVTVVRPDGTSVARDLPTDLAAVQPGPDGTLATVHLLGPPAPEPDIRIEVHDDGMWELVGALPEDGQDAVVRLEDAATGEARWERTVAYRPPADLWSCVSFVGMLAGDAGGVPDIEATEPTLLVTPSAIMLRACGLNATFGIEGTAAPDDVVMVMPYVDGGYVEYVQRGDRLATTLRAPDGDQVARFDDELLQVMATDGTSQDVRLVGSYGRRVEGRTDDGEVLWTADHSATSVPVRANGVAVALQIDGTVWGVDLETGETLWTHGLRGDDTDVRPGLNLQVQSAFTDGTTALLGYVDMGVVYDDGTESVGDRRLRLVALDLATGEVRWEQTRTDSYLTLYAARGRLFEVAGGTGSETRAGPDGTAVRRAPGTVRALG